jgi:hypothetical protein
MIDPPRLTEIDAGGRAALLIRAARREGPRPSVRRASAVALGLLTVAPAVEASLASGLTGATVAMAGVKGLLAGVVFSVAAAGVQRFREPPHDTRAPSVAHAVPSGRAVEPAQAEAPRAPVAAPAADPTPSASFPVEPGERAGDPASRAEPAPSVGSALTEELLAFGLAQRALERGDAGEALAALDRFEREFPRATLAQEAEVLRIEALAEAGRTAAALTRARAFLAAHPSVPAARRVGSLVARLSPSTSRDQNPDLDPWSAKEDR